MFYIVHASCVKSAGCCISSVSVCVKDLCCGTFAGYKVRLVTSQSAHSLHFTANSLSLLFHVWCQKMPWLWFDDCFVKQMHLHECLWSPFLSSVEMAEGTEPALITLWLLWCESGDPNTSNTEYNYHVSWRLCLNRYVFPLATVSRVFNLVVMWWWCKSRIEKHSNSWVVTEQLKKGY